MSRESSLNPLYQLVKISSSMFSISWSLNFHKQKMDKESDRANMDLWQLSFRQISTHILESTNSEYFSNYQEYAQLCRWQILQTFIIWILWTHLSTILRKPSLCNLTCQWFRFQSWSPKLKHKWKILSSSWASSGEQNSRVPQQQSRSGGNRRNKQLAPRHKSICVERFISISGQKQQKITLITSLILWMLLWSILNLLYNIYRI